MGGALDAHDSRCARPSRAAGLVVQDNGDGVRGVLVATFRSAPQ
jgi:hypothetical protein